MASSHIKPGFLERGAVCGFTDVVHSPERLQTRHERSSDKVIVTVSKALILLGRIVHTGVSGVLGRILLLADIIQILLTDQTTAVDLKDT